MSDLIADIVFRVPFNQNKQYYEVHLHDCDVKKFARWANTRWGFFWGDRKHANRYRGYFGDIHLLIDRVEPNTVAHELFHLLKWWAVARGLSLDSNRREEDIAWVFGEMVGNFWLKYNKLEQD